MNADLTLQDRLPELLTTRQAADLLGYSPEYLARLCRHGQIPTTRREGRGHYRIQKKVLLELMQTGKG